MTADRHRREPKSDRNRVPSRADPGTPTPVLRVVTCAALALAVVLVYLPTLGNGFVEWDDAAYVTHNPHVSSLSWSTVRWAFTSDSNANWHPLTWISHALDRTLYGLDPRGHHLTSVLLHAANSVLLLVLLWRLSARFWPSAAAAALFALHPLRVESVSWIAERKDLLCAFFALVALLAYERHARRPARGSLLAVALAMLLALLCKPMAVSLPLLFLLLDLWPLRRLHWRRPQRAVLLEKVPLLLLAVASSLATLLAQSHGEAVRPWNLIGAGERFATAALALPAYLGKTFWPAPGSLLPLYTHYHYLREGIPATTLVFALSFLVAALIFSVLQWARRPFLTVGGLAFFVMLVPVLGFVQVGVQRFADRYTYLPTFGLCLCLIGLMAELDLARRRRRFVAASLLGVVLVVLAALTWKQQSLWRNEVTVWEGTVRGEPASPIAQLNLANAYHAAGRQEEAMQHYRLAVEEGPGYAPAWAALGMRLGESRNVGAAVDALHTALRLAPNDSLTRASLGSLLLAAGSIDQGMAELERAVAAAPTAMVARTSLGKALLTLGRLEEAEALFRATLDLAPDSAPAHNNLAMALIRAGKKEAAIDLLRQAIRLDPDYRTAHQNLSLALAEIGDQEGSARELAEARHLGPPAREFE